MDEATRMRNIARGHLLKEERAANSAANLREKEATEGKRLVNDRKIELERLERRIFQGGKIIPRPEPEGAEDAAAEEEKSPTPPHPVETLARVFEILKQATGRCKIFFFITDHRQEITFTFEATPVQYLYRKIASIRFQEAPALRKCWSDSNPKKKRKKD